jgi:hypothetical protein
MNADTIENLRAKPALVCVPLLRRAWLIVDVAWLVQGLL